MSDQPDATDPNTVGAATDAHDDRTPGFRRDEVDAVGIPYAPSWETFALLLAGPVVWSAHFLFVYLAVEWSCAQGGGPEAAVAWTVWPTVVAAAGVLAGGAVTLRRWREGTAHAEEFTTDQTMTVGVDPAVRDRTVLGIGLMLAVLSLVAVVAVGATALVVPACG